MLPPLTQRVMKSTKFFWTRPPVLINLTHLLAMLSTLPPLFVVYSHNIVGRHGDGVVASRRQQVEPLDWVASNFTSYIADRDTNLTWPAAAAASSQRQHRQSDSPDKSPTRPPPPPPQVAKNLSAQLQSPLELAFFEDDPGEDDDDDDNGQMDGEEEEEALAALLGGGGGGKGSANADYEQMPTDYEEEDDFYNLNPVETIDWKLKSDPKRPHHSMTHTQDSPRKSPPETVQDKRGAKNFTDFDDLEALRLKTFYGERGDEHASKTAVRGANNTHNLKVRPTSSFRPKLQTQASKRAVNGRRGGPRDQPIKKKKRRRRRKRKGKKKKRKKEAILKRKKNNEKGDSNSSRLAAGSYQSQVAATGVGQSCAFVTQVGACVTYDSVEWAIRQARRLIGFSRPEGLSSLEPSESTIHAVGELIEWTSRLLAVRHGLSGDELSLGLEQVDMSQTSLWRTCPRLFRSPIARQCYTTLQGRTGAAFYNSQQAILLSGRYRTHTGQCNNPLVPNYGSSFMPFVRLNAPEYGDGLGSIRVAAGSGQLLPPARLVSLNLHPSFDSPSNDHSAMFAAWGQLINHDLALASGARVATGHEGSCCSRLARANTMRLSDPLNRVCMPILIGPGDPVYGPHGVRCHDFKRSIAGLRPGCSLGPRTQLNLVTSFVDASFVYGSTRSTSATLRSSNRRGQLAVWYYFGAQRQPLLPPQLEAPDDECLGRRRRREGLYCFRSGDSRTNQQVPLVALHTVHARQHNRLARALGALNAHWSSERVYAEARHIHIAQVQHILLTEYLPELLGSRLVSKFELEETNDDNDYWDHYDPSLNPGISQEFAAAAFRQGHSSVPGQVYRLDPLSRAPRRAYPLRELFRQPWALFEPGAMDEFLAGLVDTPAQGLDPFVSLELTGHLLEEPDEPVGLDLIAINIQRGRDQGVASYNSMREWCGLGRFADFGELERAVGNQSAQLMASLYESVDDIDLYSGGLSEAPLEGAQLGPTFACIVGHQFSQLRRADRYWFESSQGPHAFTRAQLASIKQVPLARLVCANSDQLHFMQPLAMRLPHPIYNPMAACNELPDLDLSLWFEPAATVTQPTAEEDGDDDEDAD